MSTINQSIKTRTTDRFVICFSVVRRFKGIEWMDGTKEAAANEKPKATKHQTQ